MGAGKTLEAVKLKKCGTATRSKFSRIGEHRKAKGSYHFASGCTSCGGCGGDAPGGNPLVMK